MRSKLRTAPKKSGSRASSSSAAAVRMLVLLFSTWFLSLTHSPSPFLISLCVCSTLLHACVNPTRLLSSMPRLATRKMVEKGWTREGQPQLFAHLMRVTMYEYARANNLSGPGGVLINPTAHGKVNTPSYPFHDGILARQRDNSLTHEEWLELCRLGGITSSSYTHEGAAASAASATFAARVAAAASSGGSDVMRQRAAGLAEAAGAQARGAAKADETYGYTVEGAAASAASATLVARVAAAASGGGSDEMHQRAAGLAEAAAAAAGRFERFCTLCGDAGHCARTCPKKDQ